MPSEITDLKSLSSSSFFMEDAHFPSETQVGLWKLDGAPDYCASGKSVALSPLKKPSPATCQALNSFTMGDQKVHLDMHAAGANQSLTMYASGRSDVDVQQTSYFGGGDKINLMTAQCENSLFSSSLSELFDRKMRLSSNDALYGHSVDTVASHYKEEEPFESLEEIEAQTIGNLLPNDDDFFSGMTNGLEYAAQPSDGDDMEELDLFSSVGGMDLGDDGSSLVQKISGVSRGVPNGQLEWSKGAHCYGGQPSRTLIVRNINNNVKDSELRALFEQYGDIHTLYTACKDRGFVMITYYDIRAAQNAVKVLRNKPWRHRKLDIHYSIPEDNPSEKDMNHGTLMVFNLDSSVSTDKLIQIFGVFGEIKEICETPHGSHQKFVEFYDLRAAEAALHAMNGNDIAGKQIKVELSYFGGSRQCLGQQFSLKFGHDVYGLITQHKSHLNNSTAGFSGSPAHSTNSSGVMENVGSQSTKRGPSLDLSCNHEISSSVPNKLPSLVGIESVVNQSGILELRHVQNFGAKGTPPFHPHSLPENHAALISGVHHNSPGPMTASINNKPPEIIDKRQLSKVSSNGQPVELNKVFASPGNASCPLPGHRYMWSNSYHSNPSMMWPNSLSMVNGVCTAHSPMRLHGFPRAPSNMMNTVLPINNLHVGSAPTINPSLWDRRYAYAGEFTEASGFHPGSLGSIRISNNSMHSMDFVSHNIFPRIPGSCIDVPIPPKNVHQQRSMIFPGRGLMMPMMNPIDPPNECSRSHRNGGGMQADKKQYELDIDRILRGEDKRTTLMIKNIPNKYTSKMLLATIDERHRGTYDFVYLPIDFKNKCNVGYAFINMTDPSLIIPFYQVFNGKKWEKFNSEKVASLAYARIQGKGALIVHFQNSSLMNEDKRCRPMLFDTEGPNAGDQVPFPMGVNVRTRTGKARTIIHDGNNQESLQNFANEENSSDGETTCVALT